LCEGSGGGKGAGREKGLGGRGGAGDGPRSRPSPRRGRNRRAPWPRNPKACTMRQMMRKLWSDDCGALIAMEFLFVATILVIGIIVGLANVRDAINTELSELANAILALSQGFTISGQSGCCAEVQGSATLDTPSTVPEVICVPNFILSPIDQTPCQ